jgi:hypothetical protein
MTSDTLATIGAALGNVAAIISERLRHEGAGATPPFEFFETHINHEASRLRAEGQADLAAAISALVNIDKESAQ